MKETKRLEKAIAKALNDRGKLVRVADYKWCRALAELVVQDKDVREEMRRLHE